MSAKKQDPVREALDPLMLEFGATVYACQIFEGSLSLAMALLAEHENPSGGAAFQASFDFHSEKTIGRLVHSLCEAVEVPVEFKDRLKKARRLRNTVVHGYLVRENSMHMADPKGRLSIIEELKTIRNEIRAVDRIICGLIDVFLRKYGTSTERLKRQADSLWEYHNRAAEEFGRVH